MLTVCCLCYHDFLIGSCDCSFIFLSFTTLVFSCFSCNKYDNEYFKINRLLFQWATTIKITGFVLCVFVCERRWCLPRSCELWKSFCNMLHRVILYCLRVIIINVISSMCISSLAVLNGWRIFIILSMHTLKFVHEKLQHATSTSTNLIRTVLLYFFGKILFSAKYSVCTGNVVNVNM